LKAKGLIAVFSSASIASAAWYLLRSQSATTDVEAAPRPAALAAPASGRPEFTTGTSATYTPESSRANVSVAAPPLPEGLSSNTQLVSDRLREHWRAELDLIYEDVGVSVGLDAAESDTLIALLLDQRIRFAEAPGLDTSVDGIAARRELNVQHRQEIETLIGDEHARRLAEYQRSMQVRFEVENMRKRLANVTLALTETQRKQLIQAGIERRAYADPTVFTGVESDFAITQEQFTRNDLAYQRLMDAARGVLTAEQFAQVDDWWTKDRAANEAFLRQMEEEQRKR
jgi:hypothetical protein